MARTRELSKGSVTQAQRFSKLSPIAAAVSLLVVAAGSVHAQSGPGAAAAGNANQTIVVTGIRRAIEASITTKRNADGVVEAITAEDIGKLPDLSIAESLARLPGIGGQRVDGRVQEIAIRGLSSDFASVLLNGREQVSTGDNRGVQFDQYPSEFISRVVIHKTSDASLSAQGISGTVNMSTLRPLDFSGRQVNLNVRAERNSTGAQLAGISANGNRLSASYIDQFANNTIGLAIGFAHTDSPLQAQRYNAFGWSVSAGNQDYIRLGGITPAPGQLVAILTGFEVGPESSEQRRDGVAATLEYKPNKDLRSTIDVFYSQFKTREKNVLLQYLNFGRFAGTMTNLVEENGIVDRGLYSTFSRPGQFNGGNTTGATADPRVRYQVNTRDDDITAVGWNTTYKLDQWKFSGDLSYSQAKRKDKRIEAYAAQNLPETLQFDLASQGGTFPTFTLGRSYTDPNTLRLGEQFGRLGYSQRPEIKDKLSSLRLDARRDFEWGMFHTLEVGINFSKRDKSRDWNEDYFQAATDATQTVIGSQFLNAPVSAAYAGIPGIMMFDLEGALGQYGTVAPNFLDNNTFGRRWAVHETVTTAFAKVGIETALGGIPIKGSVGVQLVQAKQEADGFDQQNRNNLPPLAVAVTKGTTHTNALPSLNLAAELTPDTRLRFGAGRTVARPRMDEMRAFNGASLSVLPADQQTQPGVTLGRWSGSGGNPLLKPWVSNNYDLSLEYYIDKGSYVALSGFQKVLQTWIYNQTVTDFDFTGYPNSTTVVPVNGQGNFTRPANGFGGKVKGTELSFTLQGRLLTPMLDGFGVSVGASDTHSNLRQGAPNAPQKMAGLSGTVTNYTVFYEKAGFSARASQRYRSPFTAEVTGLFGFREFVTTKADAVVDLQLGYKFESGPLKDLGLLFQVNNTTNAGYETYNTVNGINQPAIYNRYGRQYLFGASYKL